MFLACHCPRFRPDATTRKRLMGRWVGMVVRRVIVLNVVKNANGCRPSGMHQNAPPAFSFSRASP